MANLESGEIWQDDLLDRREDANFLIQFLLHRIDERQARGLPRSYVLNLDAAWGHGKTYFLERFGQQLKADGYLVATVNAWRDDHADDPLLAVMAAIDDAVAPLVQTKRTVKKTWQSVKRTGAAVAIAATKGAALHWARKGLGEGIDAALEELTGAEDDGAASAAGEAVAGELKRIVDKRAELFLEEFRQEKCSIDAFRRELTGFLETVAKQRKVPLFVLVDELDRCRPPYAIALLERVKHLFEIDNVVFLIATDTSQLRHAIGAVYGDGFDSQRYLFRFFDRTYVFEDPSLEQFVSMLVRQHHLDMGKISLPPGQQIDAFIAGALAYFGLSLRDTEQCFDILRNAVTVWETAAPLELVVLLPMIIGHQQGISPNLSTEFLKQMQELADRNQGRKNAWDIVFSDTHPATRSRIVDRVSGLLLANDFLPANSMHLPSLLNKNAAGARKEWVLRRFRTELTAIYNSRYTPGSEPFSVLRDYARTIRSAGRLLPDISTR